MLQIKPRIHTCITGNFKRNRQVSKNLCY